MPTLHIVERDGTDARYIVQDDSGRELKQVHRDVTWELAEARRRHIALPVVLAEQENATVAITVDTPQIMMGATPAQVPAHVHPAFEAELSAKLEVIVQAVLSKMIVAGPAEFTEPEHEHTEATEKLGQLAQAVLAVDQKHETHRQEGHTGYAPASHLHAHLEDAFVHSQETAARVDIAVAKVAEQLTYHEHPHEHAERPLPAHDHEPPLVLMERLATLESNLAGVRRDLATLRERPVAAPDHEHLELQHGHDDFALIKHDHPLPTHDHFEAVRARIEPVPTTALPTTVGPVPDHEHVFNTMLGDGLGWRCGTCGELKGS